jgi:malate synthase
MKNISVFVLAIAYVLSLGGCSGDEVRPVDPDVYSAGESKESDVFETKPKYTKEQFREMFKKTLNAKNDKAAEQVNAMFHTMMEGIESPGFSCRHSMEAAQAHLSGSRADFSDVSGTDGDMLKEAWAQLRAELGQPELSSLKSWMNAEAQKLIEPQLEMGFSGPEANNFARFVQACPDQFQSIIDELTNFLKSTNRWLEVFSAEPLAAPTPA